MSKKRAFLASADVRNSVKWIRVPSNPDSFELRCTFQYFERNLANCHYSIGNNWILIGNKHNIRSWLAKLEDEVFLKLFQGSIRREIVDSEFGFANRGNFGTYVRGASDDGAKILRIFR